MARHLNRNARGGVPSWPSLPCVLCLMLLSACAGRPTGVLEPVAASPSAAQVEMLVTTTRGRAEKPGEMFSGERAPSPTFADITVSIPSDTVRKAGEVAWPRKLPPNPETDFATLKAEEIDRGAPKKWLNSQVRKSPDGSVLSLSTGSNNHFEDARFPFREIVHDRARAVSRCFATWPSRGSCWPMAMIAKAPTIPANAVRTVIPVSGA